MNNKKAEKQKNKKEEQNQAYLIRNILPVDDLRSFSSGELDLGSAASLQTLVLREGAILAHQGNNIEMSNDYIPVLPINSK